MTFRINTQPRGFLTVTGGQTQGDYPSVVGDAIVPVISIDKFLEWQVREQVFSQFVINGAGAYAVGTQLSNIAAPFAVPATELWYVLRYQLQVSLDGVGSTGNIGTFGWRENVVASWVNAPGNRMNFSDTLAALAGGTANASVVQVGTGFFVPPASVFGIFRQGNLMTVAGAGNEVYTVAMDIIRLKS